MEAGDRVRVKADGRTGRIARLIESDGTRLYVVAYDEMPGVPRPSDSSPPPETNETWDEDALEPL